MLSSVRDGQSGVLVLRGDPGIGKTAMLEYAGERARGCFILRATGVESEMELPFSGLQQLCAPLLDRLDGLPVPQEQALGACFGLVSGPAPDRLLVGLAILSLLAEAATRRPLVCLVDDAQWLDGASAGVLSFVARRLEAESVAMFFARRRTVELDPFAGLRALRLSGLADGDARQLLHDGLRAPLDDRVRDQILAEAYGNPLALLELPRELGPATLAGGFGLPAAPTVSGRIELIYRRRVRQLPADTQTLLLLAAADTTGDAALLWRAAAFLEVSFAAAAAAEEVGLVDFGTRVSFRHPLLRSAIYRGASAAEQRAVRGALAAATDAELDPDRHAWHRAHAVVMPDEEVAIALERSAGRAQARGGIAAAAAFLEHAARLTPDAADRGRRALAAAEAKQLAGASQAAMTLIETAAAEPLSALGTATLMRLRGEIALDLRRGAEAVPLLLGAAARFESLDAALARRTYMEALRAACVFGQLGGDALAVAARAARNAPPPAGAAGGLDLLLDGLALRFTEGYAASAPALKRALIVVRREGDLPEQDVRWPWTGRAVAPELFDDEAWHALATRNVQLARDRGALAMLPMALNYLAQLHVFEGRLEPAAALVAEADLVADAMGTERVDVARVLVAACRGDEAAATSMIETTDRAARTRDEGALISLGDHARALLWNGLGRYEDAAAAAERASARDELGVAVWSLSELVEAAARSGKAGVATVTVERLRERTEAAGTEYALGMQARASAFVAGPGAAETLFRDAIDALGRCRMSFELDRTRLLYGEWLRRRRRRVDAREQLRTAHDAFVAMGAGAFAARAAREHVATGETLQRRDPEVAEGLTPQERQIAALASEGLSNAEIGAQLFISPRTVEYHLHKAFTKLSIKSRSQLHRALDAE